MVYEKCVRHKEDWPEAWLNRGVAHLKLEDYDKAQEAFSKVLEYKDDDPEALLGLASILAKQENYDEARGAYAKLANLKSDSAEIQFNAGLLEQKADNAKEAIEYYSKAIEIDPEFAEAYLNLGALTGTDGEAEAVTGTDGEAEAVPDVGCSLPRETCQLANEIGNVLREPLLHLLMPTRLAVEAYPVQCVGRFFRGSRLRPGEGGFKYRPTTSSFNANALERAIEYYSKAIEIDPEFAEAYLNLGVALTGTDGEAEAVDCFERALEIKPELARGYFTLKSLRPTRKVN